MKPGSLESISSGETRQLGWDREQRGEARQFGIRNRDEAQAAFLIRSRDEAKNFHPQKRLKIVDKKEGLGKVPS